MNQVFILIKWVGSGINRQYWIQDVFDSRELADKICLQKHEFAHPNEFYEVAHYFVRNEEQSDK